MQKTYRHNPAVKDIFSVAGGGMGTVATRPNADNHR